MECECCRFSAVRGTLVDCQQVHLSMIGGEGGVRKPITDRHAAPRRATRRHASAWPPAAPVRLDVTMIRIRNHLTGVFPSRLRPGTTTTYRSHRATPSTPRPATPRHALSAARINKCQPSIATHHLPCPAMHIAANPAAVSDGAGAADCHCDAWTGTDGTIRHGLPPSWTSPAQVSEA